MGKFLQRCKSDCRRDSWQSIYLQGDQQQSDESEYKTDFSVKSKREYEKENYHRHIHNKNFPLSYSSTALGKDKEKVAPAWMRMRLKKNGDSNFSLFIHKPNNPYQMLNAKSAEDEAHQDELSPTCDKRNRRNIKNALSNLAHKLKAYEAESSPVSDAQEQTRTPTQTEEVGGIQTLKKRVQMMHRPLCCAVFPDPEQD